MTEIEVLAGLGLFFGCFGRTMLPFLKKKAQAAKTGQNVKWENRYIWTVIFALFVSIVVTMMALPVFPVPPQFAFPLAFTFGWSSQDIINKAVT